MPDRRTLALQIRIGVFVIVALGAALGLIYLLGSQARYFERKYDIFAEFPEVGGLIEGATVRLAGVQIGRVTEVVLAPEVGGKVRVTLTVARRFSERIRKDSRARIVTQGLLGDRLVEITQGSPGQPLLKPGDAIASDEPFEVGRVFTEGAAALASVRALAGSLQGAVDRLERGGAFDDLGAALKSARRLAEQLDGMGKGGALADVSAAARSVRRIAEEVETGKGLLHALVYDEPETLRRLNGLLASVQETLARTRDGQSAIGVLLAPESARGARSLIAAMEALGRGSDKATGEEGLLSALLYDPQYKEVAMDLKVLAKNLRDVSERVAQGRGLLGTLLSDGRPGTGAPGEGGETAVDFAAAMSNLRVITDRLRAGEGTLGGLLEDPSIYENLAAFLEGAQRSFLLRALMRSSIGGGADAASGGDGSRAGPRR